MLRKINFCTIALLVLLSIIPIFHANASIGVIPDDREEIICLEQGQIYEYNNLPLLISYEGIGHGDSVFDNENIFSLKFTNNRGETWVDYYRVGEDTIVYFDNNTYFRLISAGTGKMLFLSKE